MSNDKNFQANNRITSRRFDKKVWILSSQKLHRKNRIRIPAINSFLTIKDDKVPLPLENMVRRQGIHSETKSYKALIFYLMDFIDSETITCRNYSS